MTWCLHEVCKNRHGALNTSFFTKNVYLWLIAFLASVSVGFSTLWKYSLLFGRSGIGTRAKKKRKKGVGEGPRPIFAGPKNQTYGNYRKSLQLGELSRRDIPYLIDIYVHGNREDKHTGILGRQILLDRLSCLDRSCLGRSSKRRVASFNGNDIIRRIFKA